MPKPCGIGFTIRDKSETDHVGYTVNRKSCTIFLFYLNYAPMYCSSKKKTIVKLSSFGSNFIAMKQC